MAAVGGLGTSVDVHLVQREVSELIKSLFYRNGDGNKFIRVTTMLSLKVNLWNS